MNHPLLYLTQGELLELPDARGATLHVPRGRVWITQENDRRDIVLDAGDTWTLERPGLAVAQAHGDTTLALFGKGRSGATRRSATGWDAWFSRWFERTAARHLRMGWHM